jgi:hypothetical protein
MSDSGTASGSSRRAIVIGALVLTVASAAAFFMSSASDEDDDAADRAESTWYCPDCKHAMQRTGKVEIAYQKFSTTDKSDGAPAPRKAREGIPVTKCERCSKWTARAATKCEKCSEVFPTRTDDGTRVACPKCGKPPGANNSSPDSADQKNVTPAY